MNGLFLRRLSAQYLTFNSLKTSIVCINTTVRHLNTSNGKLLSQNLCLSNEWQTLLRRSITTSQEFGKLLANPLRDTSVQQKRFKKWKKGSKKAAKDESSDEESDAEGEPVDEFDADLIDGKAIDFLDINASIISLRLDNVLKGGLNMARNKVDDAFYAGLIRVNGSRVAKKSVELNERDEIDLIRGFNADNGELLDVSRVVVKKIEDKMSSKDRIQTKLRRFRLLTVENYADDPYDGYAVNLKKDVDIDKK